MSKIKELKSNDLNNINFIELISKLLVSDKTKYVELFDKIIKNELKKRNIDDINYLSELLLNIKGIDNTFLKDINYLEARFLWSVLSTIEFESINLINKFCELNERNLILNNDITKYDSIKDITNEVNKAELKVIGKDLEKNVITLLNDDDWIIIKPLSFESSKKYGSNTRWCTTMEKDPSFFFRYIKSGVLIYCINKKTGYKVAVYKNLSDKYSSFWNQEDNKIDSIDTELTSDIIDLLKKEIKECRKPNESFADPALIKFEKKTYHAQNLNIPINNDRLGRIEIENNFDEIENNIINY